MKTEKTIQPSSGYFMLVISLGLLIFSGVNFPFQWLPIWVSVIGIIVSVFILSGFMAIEPNSARVLTLFGDYTGTVKVSGFFWANPFFAKRKISQRAHNLETTQLKVNDKQGNPIMIAAVVVWKVSDTFRAAFDVENYEKFVEIQSESALRKMAMEYSYDNFEDETAEITLRSSSTEINEMLENEISERLSLAGIEVIEARISHLAYSQEIASAMLQRQQASAVVAARSKIVEGAVGMVEMALEALSKKEIVHLDEERKAAMVSNLLVVLCSDKAASPVVNTGTLHQ
ncbi:MAG: SPFH domain-containing protein [Saprospiraceae bacterium]|jgi:regulator of protease activity HflC (stomatin/prohibitin superfamily)|nr:SPFH domain-containing protein [Saprospiraceae bacterium]MBP6566460.1 SPFH domain-containing protein [Saprospiraceae bacterium]MBP9196282.1 SPFH domain-containing protein [Saprospiraceae bacterium]